MIEPVSGRTTTQLQEIYDRFAERAESGPDRVRPGDQERFEAAFARSEAVERQAPVHTAAETQVAQAPSTDPWVLPPPAGTAGPEVPNVGERILDTMHNLREGWNETNALMEDMMSRPGITMMELMNLQVQVQQTTVMMQLVSQEVGTVSQKVDGLLRTN